MQRLSLDRPLPELVSIGDEADPADVGIRPADRDAIWQAVELLYARRLNPAIGLAIRCKGQVVLDRTIGYARGRFPNDDDDHEPVLATPTTPFCIFSASKAITAMLVHQLDDEGLLHVGDRVADYIPEFARHGKEWVTIRHVLTHRAGVPSIAGNMDISLLHRKQELIGLLCDAKPTAPAGRRLAYHAITGGFLLGEIVRRVTGQTMREALASRFLDPLGFRWMNYGVEADDVDAVAKNGSTGLRLRWPASNLVQRALGVTAPEAVRLSNTSAWLRGVVPAGNIVSTANELSRFYDMLLNGGELDGVRVMEDRTVRRARIETSYLEVDFTLGLPVRYGVGLMLGGKVLSPFGPRTPRAFGHLGFLNIHAWADPDRALSVALLTSGKPLIGDHLLPLARVLKRISYGCPRRR